MINEDFALGDDGLGALSLMGIEQVLKILSRMGRVHLLCDGVSIDGILGVSAVQCLKCTAYFGYNNIRSVLAGKYALSSLTAKTSQLTILMLSEKKIG